MLTHAISDTLGEVHHHSIGTLARDTHDTLTFHTNLNATHTTQRPDTEHPPEPHPLIPTTPWHHSRHWLSPPETPARLVNTTASQPAPQWLAIKNGWRQKYAAPRSGTVLGEHVTIGTTPPVHLWQASLQQETKPYPGCHRIRGVETVPVSVLLQTLSTAAAECGASALSDVRFESAIVVDQPQVIQVVADDESVTVSSGSAVDTPAERWVRHARARISHGPHQELDSTFAGAGHETPTHPQSSVNFTAAGGGYWGTAICMVDRLVPAGGGRITRRSRLAGGLDGRAA